MAAVTSAVATAVSAASSIYQMDQAGREQSDRYAAEAAKMRDEAVRRLEEVGIPTVEAQRIVLESPELVGLQEYQQMGPSAMEDISTDPRLKQAQMDALSKMQEMGGSGLTEAEKAQAMLMQREVAGEEQARQKSILQEMAQRGIGGSGVELAARLSSSQGAADRRAVQQAQLAAQAQQRALQAITQGGSLAGNMQSTEFGQKAQQASAADQIAQFNAAQRAQIDAANLANRQAVANQQAAISNQQETFNKSLLQQDYNNRMRKAESVANMKTGQAAASDKQATNAANAGATAASGASKAAGSAFELAGKAGEYAIENWDNDKKTSDGINWSSNAPVDQFSNVAADGGIMKKYKDLKYADGGMAPQKEQQQPMPTSDYISNPNNNGGFAGGGIPVPDSEDQRIIPGNDFEDDRVDAKINSGEMVLNLEQQQRLMDLLKGLIEPEDMPNEDIIEPAVYAPNAEIEIEGMGYKDGGTVNEDDKLARGLYQEHAKMTEQNEQMKQAQKDTNARIKALETLMGVKK